MKNLTSSLSLKLGLIRKPIRAELVKSNCKGFYFNGQSSMFFMSSIQILIDVSHHLTS